MKRHLKKFGKYALVTGLAAAAPVIATALGNSESLSSVPWGPIFDKAGLAFLQAGIGGLIGASQSAFRSRGVR